jgi:hypothetical protein
VCVPCREAHKAAVVAWRSVLIICRDCGEEKRRGTKGRCGRCYSRMQRAKKKGAVSK